MLAISAGALVYLLILPTNRRNFFGFSKERWLMLGALTAWCLVWLYLSAAIKKNGEISQRLARVLHDHRINRLWLGLLFSGLLLTTLTLLSGRWYLIPATLRPFTLLLAASALVGFSNSYQQQLAPSQPVQIKTYLVFIVRQFNAALSDLYDLAYRTEVHLPIVLLFSAFVIFSRAATIKMPLGNAGLYTMMADLIAENNFTIPEQIPYYGPGPLPFAYPPLGFYLFAAFMKTGFNPTTYLRFAPPILTLLAVIPLYFMARKLTRSRAAASIAAVVAVSSKHFLKPHILSDGLVRSLALLFALWGLYFILQALEQKNCRDISLAILFFTLTVMTHPSYTLFFILSTITFVFTQTPIWENFKIGSLVGLGGALLSIPWWGRTITHYGLDTLLAPINSHNTARLFEGLASWESLSTWYIDNLISVRQAPAFVILTALGFILLLFQRSWRLPVWFWLIFTLVGEGNRFWVMIGGILAGAVVAKLCTTLKAFSRQKIGLDTRIWILGLLTATLVYFSWQGFEAAKVYRSPISGDTFILGQYMQENTPANSTYLAIVPQTEAEWLPYIFHRTPMISKWGAEWLGTYEIEQGYLEHLGTCERLQSFVCVEQTIYNTGQDINYLISRKDTQQLNRAIQNMTAWTEIYQNDIYIVWQQTPQP